MGRGDRYAASEPWPTLFLPRGRLRPAGLGKVPPRRPLLVWIWPALNNWEGCGRASGGSHPRYPNHLPRSPWNVQCSRFRDLRSGWEQGCRAHPASGEMLEVEAPQDAAVTTGIPGEPSAPPGGQRAAGGHLGPQEADPWPAPRAAPRGPQDSAGPRRVSGASPGREARPAIASGPHAGCSQPHIPPLPLGTERVPCGGIFTSPSADAVVSEKKGTRGWSPVRGGRCGACTGLCLARPSLQAPPSRPAQRTPGAGEPRECGRRGRRTPGGQLTGE